MQSGCVLFKKMFNTVMFCYEMEQNEGSSNLMALIFVR